MSSKQFSQEQSLAIVENAATIGFKEAAEIAGVHYTTVYDWRRDLKSLGKEAFLAYQPFHRISRRGRPLCLPWLPVPVHSRCGPNYHGNRKGLDQRNHRGG